MKKILYLSEENRKLESQKKNKKNKTGLILLDKRAHEGSPPSDICSCAKHNYSKSR